MTKPTPLNANSTKLWQDLASKVVIISACCMQIPISSAAIPAQSPLLGRVAVSVSPNVFFTFDDSGSMAWSFMPDDIGDPLEKANTYQNQPNTYPVLVPEEELPLPNNYAGCVVQTHNANDVRFDSVTGGDAYVKFRSNAFNKIYYNPDNYYQPWRRPDGTDFPLVTDPTKAPIDPLYIVKNNSSGFSSYVNGITAKTSTADLTRAGINSPKVGLTSPKMWCNSTTNTPDRGNRRFSSALYYNYDATTQKFTGVDINDPARTSFPKSTKRIDCAGATCTRAEELKNFANWFTYYRTRNLLAIGSSSRAFSMEKSGIRLGYGRINNTQTQIEGAPGTVIRGVRDFSPNTTTRNDFFYNFLYKVPASGGTPLRRAMDDVGDYFMNTESDGPWSNDPANKSTTPQLACRKSYHIMMTDGFWNGAEARNWSPSNKDVDSTKMSAPITNNAKTKSYQYDPAVNGMYKDGWSNTLADVAMYYWLTDLNPKIDNLVPPARKSDAKADTGDHAFWQHLTTYTVGLGVQGEAPNTTVIPPKDGWPRPDSGSGSGGARANVSSGSESLKMVDDLWHAAVNGRGQFVSAQDPAQFESALNVFLKDINDAQTVISSVALSTTVLSKDTLKFVPSYLSGVWTGDIKAYQSNTSGTTDGLKWSASTMVPEYSARKIFTWDDSGKKGLEFKFDTLTTNLKSAATWGTPTAPDLTLINFIRGDRSKEDGINYRCRGASDADSCAKVLVAKDGRLGDFVNSTPILVQNSVDMAYEYLPATVIGGNSYRKFIADKRSRTTGVLFAGANDGMLHAFDASNGLETLGFIPAAVIGNLARLADPDYGSRVDPATAHRFYVDGPLAEVDAYLSKSWSNLVMGSAGAGARSVFAIKVDTKSPTAFSAGSVLWELNGNTSGSSTLATDLTNLGYVTSPIAVGPMKNGTWVAIFGNGVDSPKGVGALFIVDLNTGLPIRVIPVSETKGNGLGGVALIRNTDRTIVGAYAGDLQGNVWRFDLQASAKEDWKVGFGGTPLYKAGSGKPFTAAPTFVRHPNGGLMVVAGSGKLIHEDDPSTNDVNEDDLVNTSVQTLYGLWDKTPIGSPSSIDVISTSQLVQQTFDSSGQMLQLTSNSVDWNERRGCYANMTLAAGQRNIYAPKIINGLAVMNTFAPTGTSSNCDNTSAKTFTLLFNPLTCGRLNNTTISVFTPPPSTNGDPQNPPPPNPVFQPGGDAVLPGPEDPSSAISFQKLGVQRTWNQIFNFPRAKPPTK